MTMKELKAAYKSGKLSKPEYINQMHEFHERLFEHADFIMDTDVEKIEIFDGSVVMSMRGSGIRMLCDAEDKRIAPIEILNFDHYEEDDFRTVMQLIDDSFTVFDIGGNIGWYAINIAKSKPKVNVYTFEPIPKTYDYLNKNLELNSIKNTYAYNFGFSNEEQDLIFYYYPEGSGNASMTNLSEQDAVQTITCHVKKLDDFVSENRHTIDFIKCDVEGAELFAFQGGLRTIERDKPIIFTELLRKWARKFNYHPNDVVRLLQSFAYRCFTVKGTYLTEISEIDDETVETNFFFLHSVKHEGKINQFTTVR